MTDEEQGIWNGGNTRINEKRELEILRGQEDYYDATDSEVENREDLVKRQEIMDKTRIERKPMHELYKGINKQINNFEEWSKERTPWTKMGGVKRTK
tara:strand:- start:426 stop:716 length:291 start_codon:yes stop_codon:yes gene_type:complete